MRRPVASVCCAALVLTLFCAFNPSVKTWAQEVVTKLIYDVVKGDDGTYQTVQINGKEIKGPEIKVLGDEDLGFKYKTPNTIAENYTAAEVISGDASGNSHSLFYRNGDDVLVLSMTNEDWMMGYAETSGDNKKEFKIEGMKVHYYEDALSEYVVLNGIGFNDEDGSIREYDSPYPGSNIFSLASGGAIYVRDPQNKLVEEQLNGGEFNEISDADWDLILPYLEENEKLFAISIDRLLTVDNKKKSPQEVYRKIMSKKTIAPVENTDGLSETFI